MGDEPGECQKSCPEGLGGKRKTETVGELLIKKRSPPRALGHWGISWGLCRRGNRPAAKKGKARLFKVQGEKHTNKYAWLRGGKSVPLSQSKKKIALSCQKRGHKKRDHGSWRETRKKKARSLFPKV